MPRTTYLAGAALVVALAGCGSAPVDDSEPQPQAPAGDGRCCVNDPRDGDVYVEGPIHKRCDGSRLIYWNVEGGIWAVDDSTQCEPR